MLVDAGLTLGVCDWGFCVYRQQHSACLGTATAPNPVRREPSTCAHCQNFSVTAQHRGYWQEQARRYEALLNEPALPTQTLKIARTRLSEALGILRSPRYHVTMSSTAERLRESLAALAQPSGKGTSTLTVAALCRAAGISRNSLYRYHPQILEAMHALRLQQGATGRLPSARKSGALRAELAQLRLQIPKLAALIDHYFAASTELRTLLERRDRELAELCRRLDSQPAQFSR